LYQRNQQKKEEEDTMAVHITDECTACGACLETCPTGSIEEGEKYKVNDTCTDCLACVDSCPTGAIVQQS
jgi:ferredoxin